MKTYGRDNFISEAVTSINTCDCKVLLIEGPTGIGKSTVVESVAEYLREAGQLVTFYKAESRMQAYEEPFLSLLRELLEKIPDKEVTIKEIIKSFKKHPEKHLSRIVSGALKDIAKGTRLEKTSEELGEIIKEVTEQKLIDSAKRLARQDKDSFYSEYMEIVRSIAPRLSKKAVLVIDQLEETSETLLSFIESFSKHKPDNILLVLTLNSEIYQGISHLETLKGTMQYLADIRVLPKLSENDLIKWVKDEKGEEISIEVAKRAIIELDGRPLFLESWVNNEDYAIESFESMPDAKMWGFYDELFKKLSPQAKEIAIALAPLPLTLSIDLQFNAAILKCSEMEARAYLHELENYKFIKRENNKYSFTHQLIRRFVYENHQPTEGLKKKVLNLLEENYGAIKVSSDKLPLVEAKAELLLGSYEKTSFKYLLSLAERQLDEGAYNYSIQLTEAIEKTMSDNLKMDDMANLSLVKAKAFEQTGQYNNGIKILNDIKHDDIIEQTHSKIHIRNGELHLRLNLYKEALANLNEAELMTKNADDLAIIQIRKGDILRDTEKYKAAIQLATHLGKKILPHTTNDLIKAHCYRSISRALSASEKKEAIKYGVLAKKISLKKQSLRHTGNSFFVLGEAYRLNKNYIDALPLYDESVNIASSIGHKDLEIYCRIGRAAAHMPLAHFDEAEKDIKTLETLNPAMFPVEALHGKMLRVILNLLKNKDKSSAEINELDVEYLNFSRKLPGKLMRKMFDASNIEERLNIIKNNPIKT